MPRHLPQLLTFVAACLLGVLTASSARAQGYGLYEQSTCQMARAGAGVASPCDDGSAMFFNPAGLALDMRPVISAGLTGVAPRGTFTNSTTNLVSTLNAKTYPVPNGYFAAPVGKRVMVGAGVFAPYGLTTDWPPTSEGRFLGYYSSLKSIYIQPTIAARLTDNVMVGVGIDITHTSADLRQRVDLSTLAITGTPYTFGNLGVRPGTDFADVQITGSGNHVGAHFGILVKANDRVSIGARYLTGQTVSIASGSLTATQIATGLALPVPLGATLPAGTPIDRIVAASFATGGPLSNQTASTTVPLPDQFVAGIAVNTTDRLKLMVDYQFTHWQMFDALTITPQYGSPQVTPEQYGNTSGIRVGAEYAGPAILRFGFDAHNAAAPDQSVTPRLPEAPRWEGAAGVGLPFSAHARLDLAYQYVHQQDRAGRTVLGANNGMYHYYANLFSAGIVLHF